MSLPLIAAPTKNLWFSSEFLTAQTFYEAALSESNGLSDRILFVGSLRTACSYVGTTEKVYSVELHASIRLIDGFAAYKELCQLEPRLKNIVILDTLPGQSKKQEWRRNSTAKKDYKVFESLDQSLHTSYHGIAWKKGVFKNFHKGDGEIVLFHSAPVMKITRMPRALCTRHASKTANNSKPANDKKQKRRAVATPI